MSAAAPAPKLAATILLVRDGASGLEVFMVQRHHKIDFATGAMVFPGGKIEAGDSDARLRARCTGADALAADALAVRVGAIRETFEEAGLLIGKPAQTAAPPRAKAWQEFYAHGFRPALTRLTFFARAITPPGRPRRFDTRFFCVPADAVVHKIAIADGELSDLEWHSIAQARSLELPNITRVVLEDLGERITAGALGKSDLPVPFYHRRAGNFHRDLITFDSQLD